MCAQRTPVIGKAHACALTNCQGPSAALPKLQGGPDRSNGSLRRAAPMLSGMRPALSGVREVVIDTYFKQYFWSFHLLVLAGSAFLVARTVNAFVGNALATPPEAIATASPA